MIEEPKGSGNWFKIKFYEGSFDIRSNSDGKAFLVGDVREITVDEEYWKDVLPLREVPSFNQIVPNVEYPAKPMLIGIREISSKYYVNRGLLKLIKKACEFLGFKRHAANLAVPLSNLHFTYLPVNEDYWNGFQPEATKMQELMERLRNPGFEPNTRKREGNKRHYFPAFTKVSIETGYLDKLNRKTGKRTLVSETKYEFTHDRMLLLFQEIFSDLFRGEKSERIDYFLSSLDENTRKEQSLLMVYNYIVDKDLHCHGTREGEEVAKIFNDDCRATAFLMELTERFYAKGNTQELIDDLKSGFTQTLTNKYWHLIKKAKSHYRAIH